MDKLKTRLPAFTPSVMVQPGKGRKYDNIDHFTGLLLLDFDSVGSKEDASKFKASIFDNYSFIFACWLSSSGRGVRAIVRIPRVDSIDRFKLHFAAIEQEFNRYKGFDRATKNPILPLFYSYDPNILYRENPDVFTGTNTAPNTTRPEPPMMHTPIGKET